MRRLARLIFGAVLRVFFRRIELAGLERLPARGPAVLVLNHPSALIDPLFVLALLPRPASFLAKSTIFAMPLVGRVARAFDSIPVYRRQDQADLSQNRRTFEASRAVLAKGGVLALFPEGASHDEPRLLPLKTGAARIALGAAAGGEPLQVVPAGLTFTDKGTFRSEALLLFGEPFPVAPAPLDERGEPPAEAVRELTGRIEAGLAAVVLQAEQAEALRLVARAERIFSAAEADAERLSRRFELRRRFLEGWARLRGSAPGEVAAAERRIRRYEALLDQAGLDPALLDPAHFRAANVARVAARTLLLLGGLLPLALVGTLVHLPAYLLIDVLARRLARGNASLLATIKIVAALLLYPLTWAAVGLGVGLPLGLGAGWGAALLSAVGGYAAVAFWERLDAFGGAARALRLFLFRRRAFEDLAAERERIRQDLLALGARLEEPGLG